MADTTPGSPLHERVQDVELIQQALARGVRAALLRHKRAGNPVCEWRDGRVVWIAPEDILVESGDDRVCGTRDMALADHERLPPAKPDTSPGMSDGKPRAPGTTVAPTRAWRRFHGTVTLDLTRVGRDAGRVADEVIGHLTGLMGSEVTVTLQIDAHIPSGAPDGVVRTVTENSRTLKFTSQGFEEE